MTPLFDCERRCFERVPVDGAAAVLDLGYLGTVYAIEDLSLGGARLIGPRKPPETSFEILLHVSNYYLECRARQVWDDWARDGSLGIEFENIDARSTLDGNWRPDWERTEWSTIDLPQQWNRSAQPVIRRMIELSSSSAAATAAAAGVEDTTPGEVPLDSEQRQRSEETHMLAWHRKSAVIVALRHILNFSESVQI